MSRGGGDIAGRLWRRDVSLWPGTDAARREMAARLGWLGVADDLRDRAGELVWFARDAQRDGFRHALLLGMGGSSLAAEVFRKVFPSSPRGLDLKVLDTTDPGAVLAAERAVDISRTLFVVSSKSGSTIEVDSLFRYFFERTGRRGGQFVAITDPGTSLERAGREADFRRVFLNPPDIGGRYAALSMFGLVPAALLGIDTGRLLDAGLKEMARCRALPPRDNPGLELGRTLAQAALAGRDKVTLVLDESIAAAGLWIEQLLAESTGKDGKGLIPVPGEIPGPAGSYGPDRTFAVMELSGPRDRSREDAVRAIAQAGHPVVRMAMDDLFDLGALFFRWEFATAAAGSVLGVNPFDQPNVQEAKDRTRRLLAGAASGESAPEPDFGPPREHLRTVLSSLRPGRDYLNLIAYVPFDGDLDNWMRLACARIRDAAGVPAVFSYGPRYLHSTGQLHKGGPDSGVFVFITCDHAEDVPVPGERFGLAELQRAQALGDISSLVARGRRVAHIHLESGGCEYVRDGVRMVEETL